MKQWRIRREVIGGKEWFYPEKRVLLFFWIGFMRAISEGDIRFETYGEAVAWIHNRVHQKVEPATYTYPD